MEGALAIENSNLTPNGSSALDIKRVKNLESLDLICQSCGGVLTLDGSVYCGEEECRKYELCKYCAITVENCGACKLPFKKSKLPNITGNHLRKLNISCAHENCDKIVLYGELDKHETGCDFRPMHCPFCEMKGIKKDIEPHVVTCDKRIIKCALCEFEGCYKNDHKHDSIKFLMKKIEETKTQHGNEIKELKEIIKRLTFRISDLEGVPGVIPRTDHVNSHDYKSANNDDNMDLPISNTGKNGN